uniref:Uncharacterized protein n=1 Tax=Arundo donax TaxID=35708 RepID=A0A0A9C8S8_ARUDO
MTLGFQPGLISYLQTQPLQAFWTVAMKMWITMISDISQTSM